ncbi:hypothetical protein Bca52824_050394, partial [Brassica carinata]
NPNNPWATYDSYRDCSQGVCSVYCPQWCYVIFPPPPPSFFLDDEDDSSSSDFSPLLIALIGILASAFILLSYYTLISKYCHRRRQCIYILVWTDGLTSLDRYKGRCYHIEPASDHTHPNKNPLMSLPLGYMDIMNAGDDSLYLTWTLCAKQDDSKWWLQTMTRQD